jgi:hypothetical protein
VSDCLIARDKGAPVDTKKYIGSDVHKETFTEEAIAIAVLNGGESWSWNRSLKREPAQFWSFGGTVARFNFDL